MDKGITGKLEKFFYSVGKYKIFLAATHTYLSDKRFVLVLIGFGILLRIKHLLENRSLWLDEAWLSLWVSSRSMADILTFKKFTNGNTFIPGFLAFEKFFITLFGNSECSLRLWPLVASVISVFLFYFFLKQCAGSRAVVYVGLSLFCFMDSMVFYAAQVKRYSMEVLLTIILFLAVFEVGRRRLNGYHAFLYALLGAVILFSSYPSVFILPAHLFVLLAVSILEKNRDQIFKLTLVGLFWSLCLLVLFQEIYAPKLQETNAFGFNIINGFYPSSSVGSAGFWKWLFQACVKIFVYPMGLAPAGLWLAVFIVGAVVIYRENIERFYLLVLPCVFVLLAGVTRLYPFGDRFLLFLVPVYILFVAKGVCWTLRRAGKLKQVTGVILLSVLFCCPFMKGVYFLTHSREQENVRTTMKYLKDRLQPKDELYLNNSAADAYHYYLGQMGYPYKPSRIGKILDEVLSDDGRYVAWRYESPVYSREGWLLGVKKSIELERFYKISPGQWVVRDRKKRVWILLAHHYTELEHFLLGSLERHGRRLEEFKDTWTSLYLYELN